jgi:hypothetical protein
VNPIPEAKQLHLGKMITIHPEGEDGGEKQPVPLPARC